MTRSVITAAVLMFASAGVAAAHDWTSFRLNPQLNAVVTDAKAPHAVTWRFETNDGISSSPTYRDGLVYVASNDKTLSAVDFATGTPRWQFTALNDLMSAPLLRGNIVIVSEGDALPKVWDPPHYVVMGAGPSSIYGIDASTGTMRWRTATPGTAMPTGAIVGNRYIEDDGTGTILALDPSTGRVHWRTNVGSTSFMTAIVDLHDGTFLTSGGFPNAVYRIDAKNGRERWRATFPACLSAFTDQPVASDGSRVFGTYIVLARPRGVCFGVKSDGFEHAYALDLTTGRTMWDRAFAHGDVPTRNEGTIPLAYAGRFYVGSSVAPSVQAFDAATGRVLWKRTVRGPVKGGIAAKDGHLFFGDLGGVLWSLAAADGRVEGQLQTDRTFNVGSPIVVNDTLIIGSNEGTVLATPVSTIRRVPSLSWAKQWGER